MFSIAGVTPISLPYFPNSIMDFASKIGADIVVVHPGTIPYNGRGLENLIYEASKKSITESGITIILSPIHPANAKR